MKDSLRDTPYLGPNSFGEEQSDRFFGRSEEVRELTSLVIARRVVLLHAQSGAGKTSLIKAGLIPELKRREEIGILPIARVSGVSDAGGRNPYVASALSYLLPGGGVPDGSLRDGLFSFLSASETPQLLILDQFEEIFTEYPERSEQRRTFFEDLKQSLQEFPQLTLLLSMREDYLANILSYSSYFPDQLRTRMRLERLKSESARAAVRGPAALMGKPFEAGVAERLVDNLRRVQASGRVDTPVAGTERLGEYVEPVQLQIVCLRLWEKIPESAEVITAADVERHANVDDALKGFYEGALDGARKASGVSTRSLRQWFNKHLITPARTRGLVYRGVRDTAGLPNAAVNSLEKTYVIRDARGGGEWYELTHDRLVEPILEANRESQLVAAQWQVRLVVAFLAGILLLYCAGLGVSALGNYDLANRVEAAQDAVKAETRKNSNQGNPSLAALQSLESLRHVLMELRSHQREGPPWRLRFGLYRGDALLGETRKVYFEGFRFLLFEQTKDALLNDLRRVPAVPAPGDVYSKIYDELKAYLITTTNDFNITRDKNNANFVSAVLLKRWGQLRDETRQLPPEVLDLAKAQFDFYAEELQYASIFSSPIDGDAVERARKYLAGFSSTHIYAGMLSQVSAQTPSINFNRQFPGSAEVIVNAREVAGAYSRKGWDLMKAAIAKGDFIQNSEQWVLYVGSPPSADPAKLASDLQKLYYKDFVAQWRAYLDAASVVKYKNLEDASQKLQTLSGPKSPLLSMLCLAAENVMVDVPEVANAFQPVMVVLPPGCLGKPATQPYGEYMNSLHALQRMTENRPASPPRGVVDLIRGAAREIRYVPLRLAQTFRVDPAGHVDSTVLRLLRDPIDNVEALLGN